MRAYKFADADGSGLITRPEFSLLLRSLVYYKELWENFESIDADADRRITLEEFERGAPIIGLALSHAEARSGDATWAEAEAHPRCLWSGWSKPASRTRERLAPPHPGGGCEFH